MEDARDRKEWLGGHELGGMLYKNTCNWEVNGNSRQGT